MVSHTERQLYDRKSGMIKIVLEVNRSVCHSGRGPALRVSKVQIEKPAQAPMLCND